MLLKLLMLITAWPLLSLAVALLQGGMFSRLRRMPSDAEKRIEEREAAWAATIWQSHLRQVRHTRRAAL